MRPVELVIDNVKSLFATQRTVFLIHYGSSTRDDDFHDVDFFLVEEDFDGVEETVVGNVDIARMSLETFRDYADRKDPAYATEAILTGQLVFGDAEGFRAIRTELMQTPADVPYLFRSSLGEYLKATQFAGREDWLSALKSLNFALSYMLFAMWYRNGGKPIAWKELNGLVTEDVRQFCHELRSLVQKGKEDDSCLEENAVCRFIIRWEEMLLDKLDFVREPAEV